MCLVYRRNSDRNWALFSVFRQLCKGSGYYILCSGTIFVIYF